MSVAPCPKRLETTLTSSGWETKSAILKIQFLLVATRLKHPAHAKLVVERSVKTVKHILQRVRNVSAVREFVEKTLQLLLRPAAQEPANRVADYRCPVRH